MPMVDEEVTLVCGGGGVWGIAWLTGLAAGLADTEIDLRQAGAFIGTSAGSVVAAQLAMGQAPDMLFERQTDPAKQAREAAPSAAHMAALMALMERPWNDHRERLAAVCRLALETGTVPPAQRLATISDRLGSPDPAWPAKPLGLTALDAESLELRVFDAQSGISLVEAVTASCAVPGVWPLIEFEGRLYADGGIWTVDNAHLAAGSGKVLVLSPMGPSAANPALEEDIARLQAQGSQVVMISADEASLRTMALGPLDPATRVPAAEAGRHQGRHLSAAARSLFA